MINDLIPIFAIGYFFLFLRSNRANNILTGLIFISYLVFATNYTNYGLDFDIFRYLHRGIGVLVAIALVVYIYRGRVNVFKEQTVIILALFLLTLLLSFIGNDIYMAYYIHYIRNFIFIALIVTYLYFILDTDEKLQELFQLVIAITALLSLFVVIEVFQMGWGRAWLFYSNPNYLGYALLPGLVLVIFSKQNYKQLIVPLIIFSIFATGSRAAELSVVFIVLLFIFFNIKQLNKSYLAVSLLIVISTSILFFDKIVTNQDFNGTRGVLAKISLNVFNEHPINGMGYGQFRKSFSRYVDEDIRKIGNIEIEKALAENTENAEKMTHNDFLTIVAELGLIGLVFVIFLFYKLYGELKKLLLHSRNNYFLSIGLIGSSLIFSLFHNNLTSFVFWFILFVPFIMNRNYEKTS
jgi:O-antigen ligase